MHAEHAAAWRAFLATVEAGGPLPIAFNVVEANGEFMLESAMKVNDCLSVGTRSVLPVTISVREMALIVRQRVLWHYEHEALENLLIGGKAVFDPHTVDQRRHEASAFRMTPE